MSSAWTATYLRHTAEHAQEFDTLREAVAFAANGVETGRYSVDRVTGPEGDVIEGDDLTDAQLHYELGEDPYDLPRRKAKWGRLMGGGR